MKNGRYCYFHPERSADKFCEKCGKFLCEDCQYNFQFHFTSRNPAGGDIVIPKILCSDCYKLELENKKKSKIWFYIVMIVILAVTGTITWIWLHSL